MRFHGTFAGVAAGAAGVCADSEIEDAQISAVAAKEANEGNFIPTIKQAGEKALGI